jgi:hypothetical protein
MAVVDLESLKGEHRVSSLVRHRGVVPVEVRYLHGAQGQELRLTPEKRCLQ